MKFYIHTLGCKVNLYESEALAAMLINHSYTQVENEIEADVIIVNTCTVTSTSDSKSKKIIRSLRKANNKAILVAMGCYAQLNKDELSSLGVDIAVGNNNRSKIYELINEFQINKQSINLIDDSNNYVKFEELSLDKLTHHTRGFIKIQDGCRNFCTYCAIPYARGPIKSRNPESVICEIKHLVENGVKEIIISGINTGTYGQDLGNITLASLIKQIIKEVPSLYRIRLSSIELMEITDELIDVYQNYPQLARHLHIPLQGGCDNTLRRMMRKYNTLDYLNKINQIRHTLGDVAITTDYLAGFVGETEEDFNDSLKFIKTINFAGMHIFPYSRRKNTVADGLDGHLAPEVIKQRAKILQTLSKEMMNEYQSKYLGSVTECLVEQKKNGYYVGHTSNYLEVAIESETDLTNEVVKVKLESIKNNMLIGRKC